MAWSVVQSVGGSTIAGTVSETFTTANVTSGNKIVVCVTISNIASTQPTCNSVKDGASNNWTKIGAKQNTGLFTEASIWGLDVPAGDAGTKPTITATSSTSSSTGMGIVVMEVSGLLAGNTTAMCDGALVGLTGTAASTGSPAYSTTASNEFLVAVYGDGGNSVTITTAGGWTADSANANSSGAANCVVEYKNSTGGSETNGYTTADTAGWEIAEVAFKLPGAVSSPPVSLIAVRRPALIVCNAGWRGAGHSR